MLVKSTSVRLYCQTAVSAVASSRSRVSGSVVYSSRGKPSNAESADFMITRSADARRDRRPVARRLDDGRAGPAALTHEGVRVRPGAGGEPVPEMLGTIDANAGQPLVAREKVPRQR